MKSTRPLTLQYHQIDFSSEDDSSTEIVTWYFILEDFRSALPSDPFKQYPQCNDILHYFASCGVVDKVFLPGTYQINDDTEVEIDCNIIVRQTSHGVIKLDLFNNENPIATTSKSSILEVITVTCLDLENKKFALKPEATRACKSIIQEPGVEQRLTANLKNEVSNMRAVESGKARGPYFANAGSTMHGFFTMRRINGCDLFSYITGTQFNSYDRCFTLMLRCLHVIDKCFRQKGKQACDIKLENFMVLLNTDYPERLDVVPIDLESVVDSNNVNGTVIYTFGYAPPELAQQQIFGLTSDVYQLGIMFRIMLHEKYAIKFTSSPDKKTIAQIWDKDKGIHRTKFTDYPDMDVDSYQRIKRLLKNMTAINQNERCDFQTCVQEYEDFYIGYHTSYYPGEENIDTRAAIKNSLQSGFTFARKCREYAQVKLTAEPKTLESFYSDLTGILRELKEVKHYHEDFLSAIDDACLFHCKSVSAILVVIKNIKTDMYNALARWQAMHATLEQTPNNESLLQHYEIHTNEILNTPLTLDALAKLPAVIEKKLNHLNAIRPTLESSSKRMKV